MGYGDSLLAAGQAKLKFRQWREPISIGDGQNVHWFDLFDEIPYLSREPARWLIDYPKCRGYFTEFTDERITWNLDYRAEPAEIADDTRRESFVLIEPHTKAGSAPGKRWPFERWQAVIDQLGCRFIQPDYGLRRLEGIEHERTSIRSVLGLMRRASLYVGSEGFLSHLAAATNTPAVVLFGSFSPPKVLGYDFHTNIAHGEATGLRKATPDAMRGILETTVDEVVQAVEDSL